MKDGVFISGSASLPHTTIHYLFRGTGEVLLRAYCMLGGVLTMCLWHLSCAYRRCRETRTGVWDPRGKSRLQGACPPCWAAVEDRSRMGRGVKGEG